MTNFPLRHQARIPRAAKFYDPLAHPACFPSPQARPQGRSPTLIEGENTMSDTEDFATLYEKNRKAQAEANAINKAVLFDALSAAGITSVSVNFNGEGDSGQIEDITASANGNPQQLPDVQLSIQQVEWGTGKQDNHETAIRDAIEQLCYDFLEQEHGGWENNDGAFGEFTFEVAGRTINLEFNGRYCDFTTSSHTF
jgi:hypothetical protein